MADLSTTIKLFAEKFYFLFNNQYVLYVIYFVGLFGAIFFFLRKAFEKTKMLEGNAGKWLAFLIATVAVGTIFKGNGSVLKSPEDLFSLFNNFVALLAIIAGSALAIIWASNNYRKNKTSDPSKAKLILHLILFTVSSIMVKVFEKNGILSKVLYESKVPLAEALRNIGGFGLNIFTIMQWFTGAMIILSLMNLFKGTGVKASRYSNNVKTERQENLKTLDDSVRQINELMSKSSQIYKQIGDIVKNKSQITPQTAELLKTWSSVITKLNSIFDKLKQVDVDKVKYRINPLDIGKTKYKDVEKIQLQIDDLKRLSTQMSQQISVTTNNISQNKIQNIYSELYNIAMGWYNLATGYEKVSFNVRLEADMLKEDLETAESLDRKIKEFEQLKLKIVKVGSSENKLFRSAIQSALNNLDYESNKQDKIMILNLYFKIFSTIVKFIDSNEKLNIFKNIKLTSVKNKNYFEQIFNVILKSGSVNGNSIGLRSTESVSEGEIVNVLQKLITGSQNFGQASEIKKKAKELEANFTALINQRNSIDELVRALKDNKTFTPDFVVKIYNDSNLEVKNLTQIFNNINNINLEGIDESQVKDINKFKDFVDSLKRFKSIFYTALNELVNQLNSMDKSNLDDRQRQLLATKLEVILRIINDGKLQNIDITMVKDLIEG